MAENFSRYSDMGTSNLETSPPDSLSFSELEEALAALVDECLIQPEIEKPFSNQRSLHDIVTENRINYYLQVFTKIKETKKNFVRFYTALNNNIEDMIQKIIVCSKVREKELKSELNLIANQKLSKWDRQLLKCEEALKELKKSEKESSAFTIASSVDYIFSDICTEDLKFDAKEIRLRTDHLQVVIKYLLSVGTIIWQKDSNSTVSAFGSPKGIIPKLTFGSVGKNPGQFCRPWGICSDPMGRIFVADRSNHRIQIFNECGEFLLHFGGEGSGPGQFNRPSGVVVNRKCNIIVADKDNHRIQIFTYSGRYLFKFGSQGPRPGQFMYPWDVATNQNCDIAVSDSKNHRVQLFNEKGDFLTFFDGRKMGIKDPRRMLKFLNSPRGLAFYPDGTLLVTDFDNHQVLFINKFFNNATVFGSEGSRDVQFFRPQGISCDNTGMFAVADSKNYRVQVFDVNKTLIKCFGTQGSEPGQFDCPQGISFHLDQNILVVDFNNNTRVQMF